jgi:hypothetical protein
MSQRNKNNSIIFLTTLSVYLGLVLVGGSMSPVLAQAALTRNFDIQDEIEFKDDLDKKPKDDIEKNRDIDIAKALITFIEDLQKLQSIGKYNPLTDAPYSKQNVYAIGRASSQQPPNAWVTVAADELFEKLFTKNIDKVVDVGSGEGYEKYLKTTCKFKILLDKSNLELRIEIIKDSTETTDSLAENLTRIFHPKFDEAAEPSVKLIYENTKVSTGNNQVFIVTRLPRGSLDALIK